MKLMQWSAVLLAVMVVLAGLPCRAQDGAVDADGETSGYSIWQRAWYEEQGIELPRRFGVALNLISMERDIEVTDVTVKVGSRPPESIADRASFDVSNRTTLTMVRFDAWVLPFVDLYAMVGETRTETSLLASFEIAPPVGDPIPVVVEQNQKVDGPLYGGGATLVVGHGAFFAMLDANYARSDLELFDGTIDALLLSGRVGWFRDTGVGQWRVWTGLMYLNSSRTLTITTDIPIFGPTQVEVEQQPVNPTTLELGGSLTIGRRWDILVEVGSNFDDAFLTVVSGGYRF
ncbi:MAG: hypothetical protein PVG53_04530 [Holophagae bacterium]|jgi:hypothetical protein